MKKSNKLAIPPFSDEKEEQVTMPNLKSTTASIALRLSQSFLEANK